jgi:hypothetical protein
MDTILSKALREFTTGPLNQLVVNLSGKDGQVWETEFKKFLRKEPCWVEPAKQGVKIVPDFTTLSSWLPKAEEFAKKFLGVTFNLRERFVLTDEQLAGDYIPVFDPGTLNNQKAVSKALKGQKLTVYEETDVMKYKGSEQNGTETLHLIKNSLRPDPDTMGLPPNQLKETGKNFLSLRGFTLAFGLYHFATRDNLDPNTWTWFPENTLSSGGVAYGCWGPNYRRVYFHWSYPRCANSNSGARLAIPVPLRT